MQLTEKQKEQRREAVKRYQKKVDRINCLLPSGTKDRIFSLGYTCNDFIKNAVLKEIERLENSDK